MSDFTISKIETFTSVKCADWQRFAPEGHVMRDLITERWEAGLRWPAIDEDEISEFSIERAREFANDILKVCDLLEEDLRRRDQNDSRDTAESRRA